MLPQDPLASGVWRLLEELYLESASKRTDDEYAKLSEAEKQKTLLAFANAQVTVSKRWAAIVGDPLRPIVRPPKRQSPTPSN
jgi:hypothetical protein